MAIAMVFNLKPILIAFCPFGDSFMTTFYIRKHNFWL